MTRDGGHGTRGTDERPDTIDALIDAALAEMVAASDHVHLKSSVLARIASAEQARRTWQWDWRWAAVGATAATLLVGTFVWNRTEGDTRDRARVPIVEVSRPASVAEREVPAEVASPLVVSAPVTTNPRDRSPVSPGAAEVAALLPPLESPVIQVPTITTIVPLAATDLNIAPLQIAPLETFVNNQESSK